MTNEHLQAESTVIVVGASLAGWRAVEALRTEGYEGTITLVGGEPHLPYDRPPLSKQVLAGTWPAEKAVLADKRRSSELRVHEVLGHRATALDAAARRVTLDDGSELQGDGLVITTGATPRPLPGTEDLSQADGLFTLRTLDDALALRAAVTATEGAQVIVIGAGFIGSEVASTCSALGCKVTVLEALAIPLQPILGPEIGAHCGSLHGAHGVELRTGVAVGAVRRAAPNGGSAGGDASRSSSTVGRCWRPTSWWSASASYPRRGGCATRGSSSRTGWCATTGCSRRTELWPRATWPAGTGGTTGPRR